MPIGRGRERYTAHVMTEIPSPAIGSALPFLFTYRDTLFGNGFVVHVEARNGRALCVREDEQWWMYGVNPGGMAAPGADPHAAHAAFRKAFKHVLIDIASEVDGFDAFKAAVEAFFSETNEGYVSEWTAAAEAIRQGRIDTTGYATAPASSPRSIEVTIKAVERLEAADNTPDLEVKYAEAA